MTLQTKSQRSNMGDEIHNVMRLLPIIIILILFLACIRPPEIRDTLSQNHVEGGEIIREDTSEEDREPPSPTELPPTLESPTPEVIVTPTPIEVLPEQIEADSFVINIRRGQFEPRNLTIARGSKVTWANRDPLPRQVILSETNTPILRPGQIYTHLFEDEGTFGFHEAGSPAVWGRIIVLEPTQNHARLIKITPYAYEPQNVTINVGETIRWRNTDVNSRTVTGAGFDSGPISFDETFEHTFKTVGRYPYGDTYHQNLIGTVIVER